jgi:hypothetical protein
MLIQDIFFSLFDSAANITLYFIVTFAASCCNAYFFLSARYGRGRRDRAVRRHQSRRILKGTAIVLVLLWSFWAFVSALVSIQIIFFGLPLLWSMYTAGNLVNLIAATAAAVSYLHARSVPDEKSRGFSRLVSMLDGLIREIDLPIVTAVIVTGVLVIADAALYTLGLLVM